MAKRAVAVDLNQFARWVAEKPRRNVTIEIGDAASSDHLKIWAYDYELGCGQSVFSVDEIDLEGKYERELQAKIAEMQAIQQRKAGAQI